MTFRILVAGFACCLAAGVGLAADQLVMPLKWTPKDSINSMGSLDLSGALLSTKIQVSPFTDARANALAVGENREKSQPRPVTTSSDVPVFIADHMKEAMRGLGLNVVDAGGDVSVGAEVRQFFVAETNTYQGDMQLFVHLKNAAGKELWSGVVLGNAEHFGRSYKAENYNETFSDMVLKATYNLLANPGLHDAIAKH